MAPRLKATFASSVRFLFSFLYVFFFSIPNGRGNPLRLSGRIRAGLFIPHQNVAITDR